jgi:hypothetical protein
MVSLVERMIQVQFNKREKEHLSYEKAFSFASARLEWLRPFAKAAYSEALSISPEEIQSWFDEASELVPYEITARPRYSYQVLLIGLMFLERIINKYELSCLEEFKALKNSFITWLSDNRSEIATVKRTSEIDAIVAKWNTMAAMSMSEGQLPWMVKGSQYLRKGDTLYIDYIVAHPQYMRYVSTIERAIPVIDNVREFLNLVKGESYCISTSEVIDNFARGRPVLALSCSKMAMKGILTSGFEDSGE